MKAGWVVVGVLMMSLAQAAEPPLDAAVARRDIRMCEEAAVMNAVAHTLHADDPQRQSEYIWAEKGRLSREDPDARPEDRHLVAAAASVIFQLVELRERGRSGETVPAPDTMRLAARAGAACGRLVAQAGTDVQG